MIKNFKNKATKKVYNGYFSKKFPTNIQRIAIRKFVLMNQSNNVMELLTPPGNHLEQFKYGKRKGQWSLRINHQYRICFNVKNRNDYVNVELTKHYK